MTSFSSSQLSISPGAKLAFDPFKKKKDDQLYIAGGTTYNPSKTKLTLSPNVDWGPSTLTKSIPTNTTRTGATGYYGEPAKTVSQTFAPKTVASPATNYLSAISSVADKSKQFYNDRAKQSEDFYNNLYNRRIQAAKDQAPIAQEAFNQFQATTEQGATQSRNQAETQWGNDQRALAQTRAETEGRIRNKFAGQNTSDSFGVGSAQEANTNLESEFNRQTAQGLQNKSNQLFQIDQTSKNLIAQEALKLKQTLMDIQNTVFDSEVERDMAIKQAYNEAKAGILEIENNLANLKYQNTQTASSSQLSEQFLATGIPNTPAEFEFLQKNKDAFANIGGGGKNAAKQEITSAIDDLLSSDVNQVFGWGNINPINRLPASEAQNTKAKVDRLKGLVSLENANKLKGQGAISEAERTMLANAATVLNNPWISPEQAISELNRLKHQFGGEQAQSPNSTQVGRFIVSY